MVQATNVQPGAQPGVQAGGAGSPADDLLAGMHRLIQAIKQTPHDAPVERAAVVILLRLNHYGPRRLSDLAGDLCLDISTVSRQVRALEDRDLVTRTEDPADRRAVRLAVTAAGRQLAERLLADRRKWLEESLVGWSDEDRRTLARMLNRFADALTPEPSRANKQETLETNA